jgi:hypothetical protein
VVLGEGFNHSVPPARKRRPKDDGTIGRSAAEGASIYHLHRVTPPLGSPCSPLPRHGTVIAGGRDRLSASASASPLSPVGQ